MRQAQPIKRDKRIVRIPNRTPIPLTGKRLLGRAMAPVLVAALPTMAAAQTVSSWNGGNSNWSNAANWSNGIPSGGSFDAQILNGTPSAVTIDGNFFVGSLEIASGDSASLDDNREFVLVAGGFTGAGTLTNNGNFTLNSVGNTTDFIISGAGLIQGTGTFTLANHAARIYAQNNTDRLTIGSGQLVQGTGQIGIGDMSLTNNGTISANVNGQNLDLQPNASGDFTNTNTMESSGGGTLQFQGGSFINTGGTIEALAGSTVKILNSSSISGGILTAVGTGAIHLQSSASLTSVTNTASNLYIDDNNSAYLSTGFTNNGTLTINSGGNSTNLIISNPLSIGGTGNITLTNTAARIYANNSTDRLTIGSGQLVQGTGQIGFGNLSLTNNGTINANVNGQTLYLQPDSTGDFTNNATMEASGGGTLQLNGGSFVNTGGTIEAQAGSVVKIVNSSIISGGIVTTVGTGTMHLDGSSMLASVTNNGSNLLIDDNNGAFLSGGFTNNGTLTINSGGNNTNLIINNALSIGGTGTITMTNNAARIYAADNAARLTVGANQVIQGTGNIGVGSMAMTNNGLINANVNGQTLLLSPNTNGGEDFTNASGGIWQASNGGTLQLQTGQFNNNSTIQALNASTVKINGSSINDGILTTAGTGTMHLDASPTLTSVTNNGSNLLLDDNNDVYLSTGFTNNGTFTINSVGNTTDVRILNPLTIDGTGTITMTNSAARIYAQNSTDQLTLGASQTIQGTGNVGAGSMELLNKGLINANVSGQTMTVAPNSLGVTNASGATMQASNGGTMTLQSGTFNNNSTIQALNGSTVNIVGSTVNGGILTTAGTGTMHVNTSSTLTSVTNNGTLIQDDNNLTYLSTGLTNNGTFKINSVGNTTDLRILNSLTIGGTGTVTMNNNAARIYANNSTDTLTVGASQAINGTGQIGVGSMALTNNGLIDANAGGGITMQPNGSGFTNAATGTWQASNGNTMTLQSGNFTNNGTVQALNNSTVTFTNTATLTNNSGGTLTGGTYKAISTGNAATVNLSGGNVTNNDAAVYLSGALASIPQINTITQIQGAGEFHVLDGKSFTTVGALTNAGTVEVGATSTLTVAGNYVQTSGLTTVNGLLDATGGNIILNGGTLKGDGTVTGVVNNSLGIVSPGNSPGELTISGGYVSSTSSALDIELAGTTPGTDYDVLSITGGASIAGTLNVSLLSFLPQAGQTFTILNSTSLTGTFSSVNLPPDMTVTYTPTSVILNVVPEPTSMCLFMAAGAVGLLRRRRSVS